MNQISVPQGTHQEDTLLKAMSKGTLYNDLRKAQRLRRSAAGVKATVAAVNGGGGDNSQNRKKDPKACISYLTNKGCRFGDKCRFTHFNASNPFPNPTEFGGPFNFRKHFQT